VSFITLGAIFLFVFNQGWSLVNIDLLIYPYESETILAEPNEGISFCECEATIDLDENVYYSVKWGIGFIEDEDILGQPTVQLSYIHPQSPLKTLHNKGLEDDTVTLLPEYLIQKISYIIYKIYFAYDYNKTIQM
jgi:phosphate transport system permease protein